MYPTDEQCSIVENPEPTTDECEVLDREFSVLQSDFCAVAGRVPSDFDCESGGMFQVAEDQHSLP